MIRIAGILDNDVVNGEGVSVSLFLQGCPFRCKGCHNPESWNPGGGAAADEEELIDLILNKIKANNITRNLSILGGEPLDTPDKINFLDRLIYSVRRTYPDIKICLWTGFTYEYLKYRDDLNFILYNINYLIEGPFKIEERDVTLKWRGSRNQRIIDMQKTLQVGSIVQYA